MSTPRDRQVQEFLRAEALDAYRAALAADCETEGHLFGDPEDRDRCMRCGRIPHEEDDLPWAVPF